METLPNYNWAGGSVLQKEAILKQTLNIKEALSAPQKP